MEKDARYEVKMLGQASAYPRFRMFLRRERSGLRELYPPRIVQSIYFDTWRNRALEENLSGVSHREKIRYRWYGEGRSEVRGILERKVRENMLGWKDLLPIENTIAVEGRARADFAQEVLSQLTPEWNDVRAMRLLPVQWIRYEREYFSTGGVRITVDRKLRSFDQRMRRTLTAHFPTPLPDVMIVEAKCARAHHAEAVQLLGRLPLKVDKCSKFVYASSPGEGAHPSVLPI